VKEGSQEVVGGEGDMEVRDIQQVVSDTVDPLIPPGLWHRKDRIELCGEWDTQRVQTAGADVESAAAVWVTAQQQALDDLIDVGPLIWGQLGLSDANRASGASGRGKTGGSGRDRWDDQGDTTRAGLRGMKPDSSLVSTSVSFNCAKSILNYNIFVILEL
jgi:hypothetical protein